MYRVVAVKLLVRAMRDSLRRSVPLIAADGDAAPWIRSSSPADRHGPPAGGRAPRAQSGACTQELTAAECERDPLLHEHTRDERTTLKP